MRLVRMDSCLSARIWGTPLALFPKVPLLWLRERRFCDDTALPLAAAKLPPPPPDSPRMPALV